MGASLRSRNSPPWNHGNGRSPAPFLLPQNEGARFCYALLQRLPRPFSANTLYLLGWRHVTDAYGQPVSKFAKSEGIFAPLGLRLAPSQPASRPPNLSPTAR